MLMRNNRRMFGIETASRAGKITIVTKRSKVRKSDHAFLPEDIQIEDLTQASCHAYSESAHSACWKIFWQISIQLFRAVARLFEARLSVLVRGMHVKMFAYHKIVIQQQQQQK